MAIVVATFTDQGQAQRAAASLRAANIGEVRVGVSNGGPSGLMGIGKSVPEFQAQVVGVSTLLGTIAIGAPGAILGLLVAGFPSSRQMANNAADILGALGVALIWLFVAALIGLVGGFILGSLLALVLGKTLEDAEARGEGPRRPEVAVMVVDRDAEQMARDILHSYAPFELALARTPASTGMLASAR